MTTASDDTPDSSVSASLLRTRERRTQTVLVSLVVLLSLALLTSVVLYLRFSYSIYPGTYFNSDDGAALLFSSEVLRQHSLFPDWYYSTGVIFPFLSPELMLLPVLLAFSSHWMAAFRTAVAVDQLLFAILVWFVLGRVGLSRALRLLLFCFLFASVSPWMAEQTTMIAGKNWFYAQILLLVFLAYRCIGPAQAWRSAGSWRRMAWLGAIATLLFIDSSNVSQMLPPILIALIALWLFPAATCDSKFPVRPIVILVLAAVCGRILYHALIAQGAYGPVAPKFVDLKAAGENLQLLVQGLVELFGAAPPAGQKIYSLAAVFSVVKLGLLGVVFIGPLWLLSRWRRIESDFLHLLVVVFSVSLALRLFVYVFTGISSNSTHTNRYFISTAVLGVTIILLYVERHGRPLLTRVGAIVVAGVLIASSPLLVPRPTQPSELQTLTRTLEEDHLTLGYATFWNAVAPTALSDNRVKIRQVLFANGGMVPMKWLSSSHWYDGDPNARQSFLLLEGSEDKSDLPRLDSMLGKPVRVVNIGDYRALVYPFDIASRLGWKYHADSPLTPSEMRASIGRVTPPTRSADGRTWTVVVRVTNHGKRPIGAVGRWPVNLGVHLLGPGGNMLIQNYLGVPLPMLVPGLSVDINVALPADSATGNILEFDVVQDGVAWFGSVGNPTLRVSIPRAASSGAAAAASRQTATSKNQ